MVRYIFLALGHCFVLLGVIGIFLPIFPTTPFLLAALWCYGKSSEKFRQKLLTHPKLGPALRDWTERGVIRKNTKILAILLFACSLAVSLILLTNTLYEALLALLYLGASVFVLTRPSQ